jgi:hypothetical protein
VKRPGLTAVIETIARPETVPDTSTDIGKLGHWRNRWQVPERHAHLARQQGALPLGDGTWLGYRRFESSDNAERHARQHIEHNLTHFEIKYLGPEFFPDY